ncbi:MAG: tetratricopeptide repeat protein [Candidatus Omnitrophota bacterium]
MRTKSVNSLLSTLLAVGMLVLSGCAIDKQYASERDFWKADVAIKKIVRERSGKLKDADYEKIIGIYRKVIRKYPFEMLSVKAQFSIANLYMVLKKPDDAIKELRGVIQNFSTTPKIATQAQFAIGKIYESRGDYKAALQEFESIIDLYPLSVIGAETPLYMIRMTSAIEDKEAKERAYKKAIRHYSKLINEYSDTNVALGIQDYLARAHVEGERWSDAIQTWDTILEKDIKGPLAAKALLARASIYATKLNDTEKAAEIYKDFLEKYPTQEHLGVRARLALVECLREQGASNEEVIEGYKEIRKSYPDNPMAWGIPYLIFQHYNHIDDNSGSEEALQKAIAEYTKEFNEAPKGQKQLTIARLLILCYNETKDWDALINLLRKLATDYPDEPRYLLSIASIYGNQLNKPDQAIETYKEAMEKFSSLEQIVVVAQAQIDSLNNKSSENITLEQ